MTAKFVQRCNIFEKEKAVLFRGRFLVRYIDTKWYDGYMPRNKDQLLPHPISIGPKKVGDLFERNDADLTKRREWVTTQELSFILRVKKRVLEHMQRLGVIAQFTPIGKDIWSVTIVPPPYTDRGKIATNLRERYLKLVDFIRTLDMNVDKPTIATLQQLARFYFYEIPVGIRKELEGQARGPEHILQR